MASVWVPVWMVLIITVQASCFMIPEEPRCKHGFDSEMMVFPVSSDRLRWGTRLGKVNFTDCTDRTGFLFISSDDHFMVQADGTLIVKRELVLHEGHRDFFIHSWDSRGRRMTVPAVVLHSSHRHHGNHRSQDLLTRVEPSTTRETETDPQLLVRHFKNSGEGLRRRKREWVVPPLYIVENSRGPFPQKISQIRFGRESKSIVYSITGPGADQDPVGLFTMDRSTGDLYVTQALDREKQSSYMISAHAFEDGAETEKETLEIRINLIDQNDNNPVFNESSFNGEVAEASPIGFEVIQVVATDDDEPDSYNAIINFSIEKQEPQEPSPTMFAINPVTGVISVDADGLDRKKFPEYTLDVKAADMEGRGLSAKTKVVVKVTDGNDNAPVFSSAVYDGTVAENQLDAVVTTLSVTDGDEPDCLASNAKFTIIEGDPEGLFSVKTGANKQEGVISTAKALDFEKSSKHTLLVTVENEVPFMTQLPTATATVVVTVEDVAEPQ